MQWTTRFDRAQGYTPTESEFDLVRRSVRTRRPFQSRLTRHHRYVKMTKSGSSIEADAILKKQEKIILVEGSPIKTKPVSVLGRR